jgi:hypothetical protein
MTCLVSMPPWSGSAIAALDICATTAANINMFLPRIIRLLANRCLINATVAANLPLLVQPNVYGE